MLKIFAKYIISFLVLFGVSCGKTELRFIPTATYPSLKEERLGQSSYYVEIPESIFIDEARGVEGQHGFGLWQRDSVNRFRSSSGFIEIEPGSPIGGGQDNDKLIEKVRSHLLDRIVTWEIRKTETGYFGAGAHKGKLTVGASSLTRNGLDSVIAIIATLSSR